MTCAIVIPCHKESQRPPKFLDSLAEELEKRGMAATVTAVDDGSGETEACQVDAVLGSRIKMLGKTVDRKLNRHLVGRCFATMTSLLGGLSAYDTQCGAKVFKREMFETILPRLEENGFAFDVEMLLAASQAGFRLMELPVSWHEVPGRKVHMIKDAFRMAISLLRIRQRLIRGVTSS